MAALELERPQTDLEPDLGTHSIVLFFLLYIHWVVNEEHNRKTQLCPYYGVLWIWN